MKGLKQAVEVAGGWDPLAASLGVKVITLRRWLRRGGMPIEQARRIHRLWGIRIERNALDHLGLGLLDKALAAGVDVDELCGRLGVSRDAVRAWGRQGYIAKKWIPAIEKIIADGD